MRLIHGCGHHFCSLQNTLTIGLHMCGLYCRGPTGNYCSISDCIMRWPVFEWQLQKSVNSQLKIGSSPRALSIVPLLSRTGVDSDSVLSHSPQPKGEWRVLAVCKLPHDDRACITNTPTCFLSQLHIHTVSLKWPQDYYLSLSATHTNAHTYTNTQREKDFI